MLARIKQVLAGLIVGLAAAICNASDAPGEEAFLIGDGDKVVFYGDGITASEWYPTLVETFVVTRFPKWRNHFYNRGQAGDKSSNIKRFERDVASARPDIIIYNMGFGDGGYGVLTSANLESWLGNVAKSVEIARAANPSVKIVLASPIPSENSVPGEARWVSHENYPYTMLQFGQEEGKLADKLGTSFVNLGLMYGQTMGLGQVTAGKTFTLSRDGVHPDRQGQAIIAFHLLQGMGAPGMNASVRIDASAGKVVEAKGSRVSDFQVRNGAVSFKRESDCIPYPTPSEAMPFAFLVSLDDQLNSDMLQVKGIATDKSYALFIDDRRISEIPAGELADGVNLSSFHGTPMFDQAGEVMDAVRKKQVLETAFWNRFIATGKADGSGKATAGASKEDIAGMDAALKAVAEAEQKCYSLNIPKTHSFRLEPSDTNLERFAGVVGAEINQASLSMDVSPLNIDWNSSALLEGEVTATIRNPSKSPRSGSLTWEFSGQWKVTPPEIEFKLEPEGKAALKFNVALNDPAGLIPPPKATARWDWSDKWPNPMVMSCAIPLVPHLTIPQAAAKPGLAGNIQDWNDAASFVLDKLYFSDPAVPGKRLMWDGLSSLSARIFFKWDKENLYVAALIQDDEHFDADGSQENSPGDIFMTAFLVQENGGPEASHEYGFSLCAGRDTVIDYKSAGADSGPGIKFKSRLDKDAGSCLYEAAIPWSRLAPFVPESGKEFRFTAVVGDADSLRLEGFSCLEWTPELGASKDRLMESRPGINSARKPADSAFIRLGN